MKHELVEWLCIDLTIGMVWLNWLKHFFLPKFYSAWRWKGKGNP